jgi:hypothetical protein
MQMPPRPKTAKIDQMTIPNDFFIAHPIGVLFRSGIKRIHG